MYKSLTTAVKDCGIRVNSIAPEPIATPIYIKMDLLQEIAETNGYRLCISVATASLRNV